MLIVCESLPLKSCLCFLFSPLTDTLSQLERASTTGLYSPTLLVSVLLGKCPRESVCNKENRCPHLRRAERPDREIRRVPDREEEKSNQMIQERCVDQLTQILLNVTQEQTRFSHQEPRWSWRARLREESVVLSGYMAPARPGSVCETNIY